MSVVAEHNSRWFCYEDFVPGAKHDVHCKTGGCWPSRTTYFLSENGLTKEEVMRKTYDLVSHNPQEIICEITRWAYGYTFKAWKVDEHANMIFVRGNGDHALVFSKGDFRFSNQVANSTW